VLLIHLRQSLSDGHGEAPGEKPSWVLRVAAVPGFAVTFVCTVLSVFPIIDVLNRALFAAKIGGVVSGFNLAGAMLYWRANTRRKRVLGSTGCRRCRCPLSGMSSSRKPSGAGPWRASNHTINHCALRSTARGESFGRSYHTVTNSPFVNSTVEG
jgi:hypothetical protein